MSKIKRILLIILAIVILGGGFAAYLLFWSIDSRLPDNDGVSRIVSTKGIKQKLQKEIPFLEDGSLPEEPLDLNHRNITADIRGRTNELLFSVFDTETQWPEILPEDFDPELLMEYSRNPGLEVSSLHQSGFDGSNVGIGIIGSVLPTGHEEYCFRLELYEEIHLLSRKLDPQSAANISIMAGATAGVAPRANLYYIAAGEYNDPLGKVLKNKNYEYYAEAITRLLDVNKGLPNDEKLAVIVIYNSFDKENESYSLVSSAMKRAAKEDVFVITRDIADEYDFPLAGLSRDSTKDPDDIKSYSFASRYINDYSNHLDSLFVPMDSRSFASHTGEDVYRFELLGNEDMCLSYLAGVYAICKQANPGLDPQTFLDKAKSTAGKLEVDIGTETYSISVVNPKNLLNSIK